MWLKFSNIQISLICLLPLFLSACIGPVLTGLELYYERLELKKKLDDNQLVSKGNKILQKNREQLKDARIVITAFNQDLILLGQVPNNRIKAFVLAQLAPVTRDSRRLFDELTIGQKVSLSTILSDSRITSQLRFKMLINNHINQKAFKIVTENRVVYIIGDVKEAQARIVVDLARQLPGVRKVTRILQYYHYRAPQKNRQS